MLTGFRRVLLAVGVIALLVAAPTDAKEKAKAAAIPQATPAAQTLKIYQSVRDQDYRAMYYLLAVTAKGKTGFGTQDEFARDMKKGYEDGFKTPEEKAASDRFFASLSDFKTGEPVITGNKAVVSTSANAIVDGQVFRFKGQAYLILDEGVWKLDLTFDEDAGKAMTQRLTELLGDLEKVQ